MKNDEFVKTGTMKQSCARVSWMDLVLFTCSVFGSGSGWIAAAEAFYDVYEYIISIIIMKSCPQRRKNSMESFRRNFIFSQVAMAVKYRPKR